MTLRDEAGRDVPAVIRPLLEWPDGSARVWEVFFPVTLREGERRGYALQAGAGKAPRGRCLTEPDAFTLSVVLEDGSLLRTSVRFEGGGESASGVRDDEAEFELVKGGEFTAFRGALVRRRWGWFAGVELSVRMINYAPGDTASVRAVRLEFDLPGAGPSRYFIKQSAGVVGRPRLVEMDTPFVVRADAAGLHVTESAQLGEVESHFPPYERGTYLGTVDNWTAVADRRAAWVLVVPDALERRPKGWTIEGRHVSVELHPADAEPLRWRRGMAMFQRLYLMRLPAGSDAADCERTALAWIHPPIVEMEPDLYRAAGWRIPLRYEPERFPRTEFSFRHVFSFTWPHGTFDWGDWQAGGRWMNLEYDFVAAAAKEYARTGRAPLLKLCGSAAEHMIYTDFVAVSEDRWKEGGIAAHCVDHTTGSCYPSHMWAEGLTLYYQLTGDRYALQVARQVGDFFLKHIRNRFPVVDATAREMGWTLIALSGLYDTTREERYIEGIRAIVDHYLGRGVEAFFPRNAVFAVAVGVRGLDMARPLYRGEDVKAFILGVLDWLMEHRRDRTGSYGYWYEAEIADEVDFLQAYLPNALNIGYHLSGDMKYLESAWRLYQMYLDGVNLTVQNLDDRPDPNWAGGHHISWMECLQSFAELGWLDAVQYRDHP